jgi:putative ABC transport system ATP-binding protein
MISVSNLKFDYPAGGFHLEVEDLQIQSGESVAVIGASGTGKTTLLNLISGVMVPTLGKISTNGVAISALDDSKRRNFRIKNIGLIFQEFELLDYLSVVDNILLPYRISPVLQLDDDVRARANRLVEQVGMSDKLKRPIRRLSQGERQRVAICRALLTEPPLLLADEPTGNLDPENTTLVLDMLFDWVKQSGTTLVSVTHEREHLDRFDRVVDFAQFRKATANV